jgi:hypothetical protein
VHTWFWWGDLTEGTTWKTYGIDNIKMDLQEGRWGGFNYIAVAQDSDR